MKNEFTTAWHRHLLSAPQSSRTPAPPTPTFKSLKPCCLFPSPRAPGEPRHCVSCLSCQWLSQPGRGNAAPPPRKQPREALGHLERNKGMPWGGCVEGSQEGWALNQPPGKCVLAPSPGMLTACRDSRSLPQNSRSFYHATFLSTWVSP